MKRSEKYLRRYLSIAPLGLSLWRAVEAKHLGKVKLERPILDIGCGFGEFALAFSDSQIDMGIDTNAKDLAVAAKTRKYKNLTYGDARAMPFAGNSFRSAFSISTFEHIKYPKKLFEETYRILKPGGHLFLTLETDEVDDTKFYGPLFGKIGLSVLEKIYLNAFNKMFHRHSLLPKGEWIKLSKHAGFIIEKKQDIISPAVTRLFDLFLITSWPSQIVKKIIGRRISLRPKFIDELLVRLFLPLVEEEEQNGTNLLLILRKPNVYGSPSKKKQQGKKPRKKMLLG